MKLEMQNFGTLGKDLENIFKVAGKDLPPEIRAELNKAQQSVKGLFKGVDLNNIQNVDVSKLTGTLDKLTSIHEKLKNASVPDHK